MKLLFIVLQHLLPQHCLSALIGALAASNQALVKNTLIKLFIKAYDVDMTEAERTSAEEYCNFNDFFTRPLKPGLRPVCDDNHIASPADGAISESGKIYQDQLLQAKHRYYSTASLLGSAIDAKPFSQGTFTTVYLSPKDYHRVHMPLAGKLVKTRYIPGDLYSVNQTTADNVEQVFARNERLVCLFDTEHGPMAVVLVGAMIVCGISTVWHTKNYRKVNLTVDETLFDDNAPTFAKGDELGRFYLGSTAIVLFPKGVAQWHSHIENGTAIKMGESLGDIESAPQQ